MSSMIFFFFRVCVRSLLWSKSWVRYTATHWGRAGAAPHAAKGRGKQHEGQPCCHEDDAGGRRAAGAEILPGCWPLLRATAAA